MNKITFLLYQALADVMNILDTYEWECILVNDGSSDASWILLLACMHKIYALKHFLLVVTLVIKWRFLLAMNMRKVI